MSGHSQSRRGNRRNGSAEELAKKYLKPMNVLWFLLFILKNGQTHILARKNPGHNCYYKPLQGRRNLNVWGKETSDSSSTRGRLHTQESAAGKGRPWAAEPFPVNVLSPWLLTSSSRKQRPRLGDLSSRGKESYLNDLRWWGLFLGCT